MATADNLGTMTAAAIASADRIIVMDASATNVLTGMEYGELVTALTASLNLAQADNIDDFTRATMQDLIDNPPLSAVTTVLLFGYHTAGDKGAGIFEYDASVAKTNHDGGRTISPTVPWNTHAAFLAGTGETDGGGSGCWVRVDTVMRPEFWGAKGDNSYDDSGAWDGFTARLTSAGGAAVLSGHYLIGSATERDLTSHIIMEGVGPGVTLDGDGSSPTLFRCVTAGLTLKRCDVEGIYLQHSFNEATADIDLIELDEVTFTNTTQQTFVLRINFDAHPYKVKTLRLTNVKINGGLGGIAVLSAIQRFYVDDYSAENIVVPNDSGNADLYSGNDMIGSGNSDGLNLGDDDYDAMVLTDHGYLGSIYIDGIADNRQQVSTGNISSCDGVRVLAFNVSADSLVVKNVDSYSKTDCTGVYFKGHNARVRLVFCEAAGIHEGMLVLKGGRRRQGDVGRPGYDIALEEIHLLDTPGSYVGRAGILSGVDDVYIGRIKFEGVGGDVEDPYNLGSRIAGAGPLFYTFTPGEGLMRRLTVGTIEIVDCKLAGVGTLKAVTLSGYDYVDVGDILVDGVSNGGLFSTQSAGDEQNLQLVGWTIGDHLNNVLTQPEDLSHADWSSSSATRTAATAIAPDGRTVMSDVDDTSTSVSQDLQQVVTVADDSEDYFVELTIEKHVSRNVMGIQCQLTGGTGTRALLYIDVSDGSYSALVDLASGVKGVDYDITDTGTGHWRVWFKCSNNGTGNTSMVFELFPSIRTTLASVTDVTLTGKQVVSGVTIVKSDRANDYFGDSHICRIGQITERRTIHHNKDVTVLDTDGDYPGMGSLFVKDIVALSSAVKYGVNTRGTYPLRRLDIAGGDLTRVNDTAIRTSTLEPAARNVRNVAGHVETPVNQYVKADFAAATTLVGTAPARVPYANSDADGWSDTLKEWTVPVAGRYTIMAQVEFTETSQSNWAENTAYTTADRVEDVVEDEQWRCARSHTSEGPSGTWATSTAYDAGEIVTSNTASSNDYICLTTHTSDGSGNMEDDIAANPDRWRRYEPALQNQLWAWRALTYRAELSIIRNVALLVADATASWAVSTAYSVSDIILDDDTGVAYECDTAHTSSGSGSFADHRAANPTHWSEYSTQTQAAHQQFVTARATDPSHTAFAATTINLEVGDKIYVEAAHNDTNEDHKISRAGFAAANFVSIAPAPAN